MGAEGAGDRYTIGIARAVSLTLLDGVVEVEGAEAEVL